MSRTERVQVAPGKEWWGKRPLASYSVSRKAGTDKWFKRWLHKIERVQSKNIIIEEINSL